MSADRRLHAGYDIYPAELERVLAGHPDVALVAVGSIPDDEKGELATAYIVPKANVMIERTRLRIPIQEEIDDHVRYQ